MANTEPPMCKSPANRRNLRLKLWIACAAVVASTFVLAKSSTSQVAPRFPTAPRPSPVETNRDNPATESKIESYPLNDITRQVLVQWQAQTTATSDVRVAIDERTGQALVFAPPRVQGEIRERIAQQQQAPPAPGPEIGHAAAPQQSSGEPALAGSVNVELRHLPAAELHARLQRLLSHDLPLTADSSGDWQGFVVEASPGAGVTINVNQQTSQVRIDGPPQQVAAWRSVIDALDSPPTPGNVTQLVATKPAVHERVRQALQVLQTPANGSRGGIAAQTVAMQQPQAGGQGGAAGQPGAANPPAAAGQQETIQVAPGPAQTAEQAAELAQAAGGLLGPVQVEYVEGLDVIVLRGAERDVERVMQIIQQIEELSAVTVPTILVQPLQHVNSMQLGALLNRLYTLVLGPRIGTVSITPLGTPNALLLIGRKENVDMAVNLIQQLDQPALPAAQFQVFPLQNASATEAKTLIDAFLRQNEEGQPQQTPPAANEGITLPDTYPPLAPRALVVADVRTNFLIVRAAPRDLAMIAALLQRIDKPGATAQLKVFTIRNGDATTLVTTLRTLFSIAAEGEAATPGGLSQGGIVRLQFSVDPRTNSIIAAGSAEDLAVVEAILLRLDQGDVRERVNRIYRLNNAAALDVANALNQWLIGRQTAQTQAEVTVSPFEQIEQEVVIVPEQATNSLIVSATPRYYEEVRKLIEQLDERPPMVMIQVLIGEVRLNDTDEFGIELGLQDSLLFDRSLLSDVQTISTTTQTQTAGGAVTTVTQDSVINANGVPGFNFNNLPLGNNLSTAALSTAGQVAAQGLSSFSLNRVNNDLGFGGFVFSASSNSVSMLLRALQENRRLEVLSRPQLMALDGQQGSVQVGQNVPRIVATNVDPLAGTTNTITYEQVGLILNVVPRISPDGLVVLTIQAIKSEVGPEAEGIPISVSPTGQVLRAPRIDITQALTTVSALSGQTVVLGGLLQTRKFDVHRRVPLIADIPLIGDLFRYDSVAEERRELLIILTPRIIYGKEDSDLVKQIESSRMSWILGDVINLHGESGLRSRCDEWNDADIEAVYPNFVPEEGLLPLSNNQLLIEGGPMLAAPCSEPCMMPMTETTTLPAYEEPPANQQVVPMVPLPPQPRQAPAPGQPQSSTSSSTDRYGFVNMASQDGASVHAAPLRLPESSE